MGYLNVKGEYVEGDGLIQEFFNRPAIFDNDAQIEEVWKTQYGLAEYSASTNFKSYEELKTRLDAVLSGSVTVGNVTDKMEDAPIATPVVDTAPVESAPIVEKEEEEDSMAYFEKLANA